MLDKHELGLDIHKSSMWKKEGPAPKELQPAIGAGPVVNHLLAVKDLAGGLCVVVWMCEVQ